MLTIQKTTDYSQFKFLKDKNRTPCPDYMVRAIEQKNLLEEHPIICDRHMNVIDGQHRLLAAKILKLPIYYIISENITEDDIGLCQTQKTWSMSDFLKFYKDKEDYAFVEEMMQLHTFPIHFIISCCNSDTSIHHLFRIGKFVIKKDKKWIKERIKCESEILDLFKIIRKNSGEKSAESVSVKMLRALWVIVHQKDYDHKRMMHAINTHPDNVLPVFHFNSEKLITQSIMSRLYNFKRRGRDE